MIDSHAHLSAPPLLEHAAQLLARAQAAGVLRVVNICTDAASLEAGLELQAEHPALFLTAATTPHDSNVAQDAFLPMVAQCAAEGKLVAIGETGLDYHYSDLPKDRQQVVCCAYLHLAREMALPLVFHCREAFEDLFALADREFPRCKAVLHCFTGTKEEALACVERGWLLSLSGIVTFKNSVALQEVAREVPLKHLLIETDAPYLAPQSRRGKTNEPAFVGEVAEKIATLKQISVEEVARVTTLNAETFFSFPKRSATV